MCRRFGGGVASESTSVKSKGCRMGQRKNLNCEAVIVETSSDPTGSSGGGGPFKVALNRGEPRDLGFFYPHSGHYPIIGHRLPKGGHVLGQGDSESHSWPETQWKAVSH